MIRPEGPLPTLAGLGIHTRRVDATRPNGDKVTFLADDVCFIETRDARFLAEAPGLHPIPLDAAAVRAAAWGLPNLVAAAVHEARRAARDDDPVGERLAVMLATGLRLAAGGGLA